jgi:hypothetical protein
MAKTATKKKPKKAATAAQKRARRRDANPLYNPATQLSGNQLALAASRLTDLQFKPQEQALDAQSKAVGAQGTALAGKSQDYYREIAHEAAAAVANQNAIRDRLNTGLAAIGDQAQARTAEAGQAATDAASKDASLRGQGLSGGGDAKLAGEIAAEKANVAQSAGTFRSAGELQSGNYAGLSAASQGSTAARGGEEYTRLLNRVANLQAGVAQKKADLSSQRGAAKEKNVLDLRQQGFENAVTAQGLGIDQAKLDAQINQDAAAAAAAEKKQRSADKLNEARLGIAQQNADTSSANSTETKRHHGAQETAAQKKAKKKRTAGARATILKGRSQITQAQTAFSRSGGNYNAYLQGGVKKGFPLPVLHAGYELAHQGYVGPNTVKQLRQLGITVPAQWTVNPHSPLSIGAGRSGVIHVG